MKKNQNNYTHVNDNEGILCFKSFVHCFIGKMLEITYAMHFFNFQSSALKAEYNISLHP